MTCYLCEEIVVLSFLNQVADSLNKKKGLCLTLCHSRAMMKTSDPKKLKMSHSVSDLSIHWDSALKISWLNMRQTSSSHSVSYLDFCFYRAAMKSTPDSKKPKISRCITDLNISQSFFISLFRLQSSVNNNVNEVQWT